jgi:hypothetical protein
MAIDWKQRATVMQLLAAVYAELGEEAVGNLDVKTADGDN